MMIQPDNQRGVKPGNEASSPTKQKPLPKCFDSRAASLNPTCEYPPIGTEQRDKFLYDLAMVGAAPFMQCVPHHHMGNEYRERARMNRERLERDRERERAERMAAIAA